MNRVELHHGARTDIGRVRAVNQDAYLAAADVFVVADGMGGHDGGEVASAIAVGEFAALAENGYDPRQGAATITATLEAAQQRIAAYVDEQQALDSSRQIRAGTTVVAAILIEDDDGPLWLVANLGDSRAYVFTEGVLRQVSVDHSLVQELVASGSITPEEALTHPERNVVTRALDDSDSAAADFFTLPVLAVERLLLCSDGITGMIDDATIAGLLGASPDPRDAADRVVAAAVEAGGEDNATAVVIDVVGIAGTTAEAGYDAEQQRASLEAKLGGQS